MNAKLYFLVTLLAFFIFSCKSNSDEENTSENIYVMGTRAADTEVVEWFFLVDDIISFNKNTREIIFPDSITEKITIQRLYSKMTFYNNDNKMFESMITNTFSSRSVHDLVLVYSMDEELRQYRFYLVDGYPILPDDWRDGSTEEQINVINEWFRIREENALKRKDQLDFFIKYLTDRKKIIQ